MPHLVKLSELPPPAAQEVRKLNRRIRLLTRAARALEALEAEGYDGSVLRCSACPRRFPVIAAAVPVRPAA